MEALNDGLFALDKEVADYTEQHEASRKKKEWNEAGIDNTEDHVKVLKNEVPVMPQSPSPD